MATKLKGSVGRRGKNDSADVKAVQELLKPFAGKLKVPVKVDGKPSPGLEKAIGKFQEEICKFKPDYRVDPGKTTISKLNGGLAKANAEEKALEKEQKKKTDDQRKKILADVKKTAEKETKAKGLDAKSAKKVLDELEAKAQEQWDALMKKVDKAKEFDFGDLVKGAESLFKDITGKGSAMEEIIDKNAPDESGEDAKVPLTLKGGITDIYSGGFTFTVSGKSPDKKAKVLLLPEKQTRFSLDITKGFNKAMCVDLFKKLDAGGYWGKTVAFYAIETTEGQPDWNTLSNAVKLATPVAPFKGTVSLTGIAKDKDAKYTGNGTGRYLYTKPINGWWFFKYGSNFERDPKMRGYDCITYVGTANKTEKGMGARGDGLAKHLGAKGVNMENKTKEEVVEFFKGDGKTGTYIAWWGSHCIAVQSGTVHEYSEKKGGYRSAAATKYWWPASGTSVRKL